MIDKLEAIINTFDDLSKSLSDPEVISNSKKFAKIAKEHNSLTEIVEKAKDYISKTNQLSSAHEMLDGCLLYTSPSPRDQRGSGIASYG